MQKCDRNVESLEEVKTTQEDQSNAQQMFKCDQCDRYFNEKWKLNAHLKTCKINKCDVCE